MPIKIRLWWKWSGTRSGVQGKLEERITFGGTADIENGDDANGDESDEDDEDDNNTWSDRGYR